MTSIHSVFLKEMGITEWTPREGVQSQAEPVSSVDLNIKNEELQASQKIIRGIWWFFGNEPQGDAKILFQNVIRALGLARNEWLWKNVNDLSSQEDVSELPVVAIAFGGPVAQKITGETDSLPQLRETVLALNSGESADIPVIATFELNQVLTRPKEKALLWQDLLLARSVLQNS